MWTLVIGPNKETFHLADDLSEEEIRNLEVDFAAHAAEDKPLDCRLRGGTKLWVRPSLIPWWEFQNHDSHLSDNYGGSVPN